MNCNIDVSKYEYISFDIFDTLIKRDVCDPHDVFKHVVLYCKNYDIPVPDTFPELRIEAEHKANSSCGGNASIDDIYRVLSENIDNAEKIKRIELLVEQKLCVPNGRLISFYNRIKKEKKIVLISDMYLSKEYLEQILEVCGINGYHKLFVSCEEKARKSDGRLFKKVLSDLNINAKQLIHFGDNRRGDYIIPKKLGIKAVLVKESSNSQSLILPHDKHDELTYNTIKATISNYAYGISDYEKMGLSTFGPLLAGFAQWLADELKKEEIHDVLFMARDGYMMKRAYDIISKDTNSIYMYCSRRSFTVPLIWKKHDFDSLFEVITFQDRMTLRQFVLRVGLDPEEYLHSAKEVGLALDYTFEHGSFKSDVRVRKFYEIIKHDVIDNSKNEFDALSKYLKELNLPEKIAVVDIGRHGTMQYAFQNMLLELGIKTEVVGYYVGLVKDSQLINSGKIDARGYLYAKDKNEYLFSKNSKFMSLFESIFLAHHGSVEKFDLNKNDEINVKMYPYEYEVSNGMLVDEKAFFVEYQEGGIKLVELLCENNTIKYMQISPVVAFNNICRLGTRPTLQESRLWGKMRVFDNIIMYNAIPRSLRYYFTHPKNMYSEFVTCLWKIGFMKQLFKIPCPYEKIYDFLQAWFHKRGR